MRAFALSRFALSISIATALIAGCGGSQPLVAAPRTMQQSRVIATHAGRATSWMPSGQVLLAPPTGPFLYAASLFYKLSEYAVGGTKPLHSITLKNRNGLVSLTVNSADYVFAETGNISHGYITVYDARTLERVRGLNGVWATFLSVDRDGYVYGANCGDGIVVIAPDGSKIVNEIYDHAKGACSLAHDRSNDLFVADGGAVSVYSPTKRPGFVKYLRSITNGIKSPQALAFGPSGDLFVANCPTCPYSNPGKRHDYVSVYLPGASSPFREISADVKQPDSLTLDSTGRLYVANSPVTSKSRRLRGWITVYGPGRTRALREITEGINQPVSLAIDPSDNIYVASERGNTVTVYNPGGTKLLHTITSGVHGPVAITIASD